MMVGINLKSAFYSKSQFFSITHHPSSINRAVLQGAFNPPPFAAYLAASQEIRLLQRHGTTHGLRAEDEGDVVRRFGGGF